VDESAPESGPEPPGVGVSSNPFVKRDGGNRDPAVVSPAAAEREVAPSQPRVADDPASDAKNEFLTVLHDDACRRFGTVLGPNANEAHKDHFHLDMKKRRRSSFCE
jgi:hypothetical protein